MTLSSMSHPTKLVNTTTFLVYEESFSCLHEVWLCVLVEIEITKDLVRIKVVLFYAEWSGHFTARVHLWLSKHDFCRLVFNDIACFGVLEITSLVCKMSLQISWCAILVTEHNYVTLFISIEFAQDIVFIESPQVSVGWYVDLAFKLLKTAQDLVSHLNRLVHFRLSVSIVFSLLPTGGPLSLLTQFFFFSQTFQLILLQLFLL
jgi:hypothetical protein